MPGAIFLDPGTFAAVSLKAGSGPESSDSSVSSEYVWREMLQSL